MHPDRILRSPRGCRPGCHSQHMPFRPPLASGHWNFGCHFPPPDPAALGTEPGPPARLPACSETPRCFCPRPGGWSLSLACPLPQLPAGQLRCLLPPASEAPGVLGRPAGLAPGSPRGDCISVLRDLSSETSMAQTTHPSPLRGCRVGGRRGQVGSTHPQSLPSPEARGPPPGDGLLQVPRLLLVLLHLSPHVLIPLRGRRRRPLQQPAFPQCLGLGQWVPRSKSGSGLGSGSGEGLSWDWNQGGDRLSPPDPCP